MHEARTFLQRMTDLQMPIALITSGGTAVPLEKHMVRFLDNFSTGLRGALSAEYFLQNHWAVLFLHRGGSLKPFERKLTGISPLELFDSKGQVATEFQNLTLTVIKDCKHFGQFLYSMTFFSVNQYLALLENISILMCQLSSNVSSRHIIFLAAAVSDFYLPEEDIRTHKIQSHPHEPLTITLKPVEKVLQKLVKNWCPDAFVVSFKLETDPKLLLVKSQNALSNYGHQVVVANILETRKDTVDIITNKKQIIRLTRNSCRGTPNPVLLPRFNSYSVHSLEFDEENIEQSIIDHILKLYKDENL